MVHFYQDMNKWNFKCLPLSILVIPTQILKAWGSKMGWEFETEHSTGFEGEVNFVIWSQSTLSLQILS